MSEIVETSKSRFEDKMADLQKMLLAKQAEILAIEAEIQGMVAENLIRVRRDEALAYNDVAFSEKAEQLRNLADYITRLEEAEKERTEYLSDNLTLRKTVDKVREWKDEAWARVAITPDAYMALMKILNRAGKEGE
jgi:hypothetical protein